MRFAMDRHVADVGIVPTWRTARWNRLRVPSSRLPLGADLARRPAFIVGELVPHDRTTQEFAQAILAIEATFGSSRTAWRLLLRPRRPRRERADHRIRGPHLSQMGLNPAAKPSGVRDGCMLLMSTLADEDLPLVISRSCEWTVQAFANVKTGRRNEGVYDESSEFCHALDAARYYFVNRPVFIDYDEDDMVPETTWGPSSGLWGRVW